MTYQFRTPSGPLTVDHTYTIGRLLALGAEPVNFKSIKRVKSPRLSQEALHPPPGRHGWAGFFCALTNKG